ncbi:MAG: thymidylate kinase [Clostridiales bacterium]|nr:thymidylate kinase [Clostridiales bacterium]
MGKLIVIDGLDGSGKQTQAALLARHLEAAGHPVRPVSFPTYTESSAPIRLYLEGALGSLEQVNVYAASAFYAVDRYASYRRDWGAHYEQGGLVLADRYTTANLIHQMGKLDRAQWEDYIAWLEETEYGRFGLPRPDLVLFLDLPVELSAQLLERRYGGDPQKRDLHERDAAYLRRCRETAGFAAGRLGWKMVTCADGANIREVRDIAEELLGYALCMLRGS